MAKIKDAIIDGVYVGTQTLEDAKKAQQSTLGWYGQYLEKRAKQAEVEDLTDEWYDTWGIHA